MTNEKNYEPVRLKCNGATKDFPFDFQVHKNSKTLKYNDLIVTLINRETKEETILTENTDYTINAGAVGGNITTNIAYSEIYDIEISRKTSHFQEKNFSTSSGFQASEVENSLDRVSCSLQDMDYNIENFKSEYSAETNKKIENFEDEINSKLTQVNNAVVKLNRLDEIKEECEDLAATAEMQANEVQKVYSKINQNSYIQKTGDTMTGNLKIQKDEQMWIACNNTSAIAGTTGDERQNIGGYKAQANGTDIAIVQGYVGVDGESGLQLITRKPDNSGYGAAVNLFTDVVGEKYFDFPKCTTPATTTSSASGSKAAVVVQNYVNGASWYRIWSDGWIEQGGYSKGGNTATTVTFPKPFANTNYTITLGTSGTLGTNNNGICSIPEKTTSGFKLYSFSSYECNWYACGY